MIGAMQAVALRHERKKQENSKNLRPLTQRPSHLHLPTSLGKNASHHGTTPRSPGSGSAANSRAGSPTPSQSGMSPLQTASQGHGKHVDSQRRDSRQWYNVSRNPALYCMVIAFVLGVIVLIVGLVQLKPRADANAHKFYIISAGAFLIILGIVISVSRCCYLCAQKRKSKRRTSKKLGDTGNDHATSSAADGTPYHKGVRSSSDMTVVTVTGGAADGEASVNGHNGMSIVTSLKSPFEHDVLITSDDNDVKKS